MAKRSPCNSYEEAEEEEEEEEEEATGELLLPLPLHLAIRILAVLPIPCIAQLRLVCRSWSSLLSSASFLSNLQLEFKQCKDSELWFVMAATAASSCHSAPFSSHEFIAFSPSFGPWKGFRLPLHSSPKLGDLLLRIAFSQSIVPSVVNMLVASAGGLMCAVVKGGQLEFTHAAAPYNVDNSSPSLISKLDYDVVVFNCLTGSLKTLPRPQRLANKLISSCAISMRADAATNTYGIILSDLKHRDMEIYDSRKGCWSSGLGVRAEASIGPPVLMTDLLESDVIRYHKEELVAYNAGSNVWKKVDVTLPRCPPATELLRSTVIKCNGRVLLVACLMKKAVSMKGFGVWELVQGAARGGGQVETGYMWAEVGRTPANILAALGRTHFDSPSFYDCRFVGGGGSDALCMTGAHYSIGSGSRAEYWPPVIYDLACDEWRLLPSYKQSTNFLCVFPFEPTFNAAV